MRLGYGIRSAQSQQVSQGGGLPSRQDIAAEFQWRLEDMYASNEAWQQDVDAVGGLAASLQELQGKVGESAENLHRALSLQDQLEERLSKIYAYARMRRDEDNTNATYQAMADQAMSLWVQTESAKAFLVPEILQIPNERIHAFLDAHEPLQLFRFELEELLRQKPHVLSAEQEALLAAAGEMASAPQQIFTMFNNADMKFPTIQDESGRDVELTHGRYIQFLESKVQSVRKAAFDAMYSTYGKHRNTLAAIYAASVKKDVFYARVRNYESALQASLDDDNVPVSVYDNLLKAVHESLPQLHKYLELRKRALGLDALHMYDLYTPMVGDVDMTMDYPQAVEVVQRAIAPLGAEYQRIASEGLQSGWVDVYETKGKTSGAYSWGAYGVHPYILLNYQGRLDDVFTLAHELGHAMHTYLSNQHQPHVYASYTIFVAEVASTCNEALLTHHLLQTTDNQRIRAYLLNHHLESIRATLFRQTMFAEFEKLTHEHVEAGGSLTPEWLCETYYHLNQQYYGAVCTVDEDIAMEWARIPHFYTPFYVYKYATGISAATALSQRILTEGQSAVEQYLGFLKSGRSDYPIALLKRAGVDMESPEPVRTTLELFGTMVDELAGLLS
ncbi:oligoendopeptidase F [Alicyclobacillus contaminans]|uniref:oligoendopeptidase F n=1 Tax=Alicyclobacillus contaminans TaxID=392016 RepID=UPI00041AD3CC|nr:oligoendopeptidase F [Alicyclobacillus contaminans]GMA49978.1 oligoendopeptidase F [Alicyclobacillus contaminans]